VVAASADLASLEAKIASGMRDSYGINLHFAVGSSGMLPRQIENGAPYDVYLSANQKLVDELAARRLVLPETVRVYAWGAWPVVEGWQHTRPHQLTGPRCAIWRFQIRRTPPMGWRPAGSRAHGDMEEADGAGSCMGERPPSFRVCRGRKCRSCAHFLVLLRDREGVLIDESWHAPIVQAGAVVASTKDPLRRGACWSF
jgi:hypothetical protein